MASTLLTVCLHFRPPPGFSVDLLEAVLPDGLAELVLVHELGRDFLVLLHAINEETLQGFAENLDRPLAPKTRASHSHVRFLKPKLPHALRRRAWFAQTRRWGTPR